MDISFCILIKIWNIYTIDYLLHTTTSLKLDYLLHTTTNLKLDYLLSTTTYFMILLLTYYGFIKKIVE